MEHKNITHIWVIDEDGNGYVCHETDSTNEKRKLESLSEEVKTTCKEFSNSSGKHSLENLDNLKLDTW